MKTERRHTLQTNELADVLGTTLEQVKPYARLIVGVALAILVLVTTYFVLQSRAKEAGEAAWSTYFARVDAEDFKGLESLAKAHRDQPAGQVAALRAGDWRLAQGIEQLFWDRSKAQEELRSAEDDFQIAAGSRDALVKQRAVYGLAMALESQPGKLDRARDEYRRVVKEWPDSTLASEAKAHLEQLDSDKVKEFYDWFATETPKMGLANRPGGDPGGPGGDFDFHNPFPSLDGDDDLKTPRLPKRPRGDSPGGADDANSDAGSGDASEGKTPPGDDPENDGSSAAPADGDKTGSEKTESEKTESDKTGDEKSGNEKSGNDKQPDAKEGESAADASSPSAEKQPPK